MKAFVALEPWDVLAVIASDDGLRPCGLEAEFILVERRAVTLENLIEFSYTTSCYGCIGRCVRTLNYSPHCSRISKLFVLQILLNLLRHMAIDSSSRE